MRRIYHGNIFSDISSCHKIEKTKTFQVTVLVLLSRLENIKETKISSNFILNSHINFFKNSFYFDDLFESAIDFNCFK